MVIYHLWTRWLIQHDSKYMGIALGLQYPGITKAGKSRAVLWFSNTYNAFMISLPFNTPCLSLICSPALQYVRSILVVHPERPYDVQISSTTGLLDPLCKSQLLES